MRTVRSFNKATLIAVVVVGLTLSLVWLLSGAARPAQASAVTGVSTHTMLVGIGITQTLNGDAWLAQSFGQGDCYAQSTQAVSPTNAQTVTFNLYHGPDAADWVGYWTFPAQPTDTIAFTRTLFYGNYQYAAVSLFTTTRPVTVSVVCVGKNIQQ